MAEAAKPRVVMLLTEDWFFCSHFLERATAAFIDTGIVQLAVDSALTSGQAHDESLCFTEMDAAESILRRIRDAFGDIARLHYPWHPDD